MSTIQEDLCPSIKIEHHDGYSSISTSQEHWYCETVELKRLLKRDVNEGYSERGRSAAAYQTLCDEVASRVQFSDGRVCDFAGGVWHPTEESQSKIDEEGFEGLDPEAFEAEAVRLCFASSENGSWHT